MQFDFQARELWQASHLHQFDFLPGVTVTRVLNPNNIVYLSTLLQLRGGDYFVSPTREIDPFYTVGYIHRRGLWTLVVNDTLVTNFRHPPFNDSIPPQSNMSMITDIELNRPVSKKFPALVSFLRAEPIWNWDSHRAPGISGFDFRFFGGLRIAVSKPSYYAGIENLRKQVMESGQTLPIPPKLNPTSPSTNDNKAESSSPNASSPNTDSPNSISPSSAPDQSDHNDAQLRGP